MTSTLLIRIGLAVSLAVSAASHAYLYIHGYQHIPTIGTAFLIQASVSFALALLIILGGPGWLQMGRRRGGGRLPGGVRPVEDRWAFRLFGARLGPAPHAAISVAAEALTVLLWAGLLIGWVLTSRRYPVRSELQRSRGQTTSA